MFLLAVVYIVIGYSQLKISKAKLLLIIGLAYFTINHIAFPKVPNLYKESGLVRSIPCSNIMKEYKKLLKVNHPDHNTRDDAYENFYKIKEIAL